MWWPTTGLLFCGDSTRDTKWCSYCGRQGGSSQAGDMAKNGTLCLLISGRDKWSSVSSRPTWSTYWLPGWPRLHSETLSQKQIISKPPKVRNARERERKRERFHSSVQMQNLWKQKSQMNICIFVFLIVQFIIYKKQDNSHQVWTDEPMRPCSNRSETAEHAQWSSFENTGERSDTNGHVHIDFMWNLQKRGNYGVQTTSRW